MDQRGSWTRVAAGLAALFGTIAIWSAVQVGIRYDDPVYRFEPLDLVMVGVGVVALVAVAFLLLTTQQPDIAVLVTLTSVLVAVGLVGILSVGVFFLLAALIPGVVLTRRMRRPSARSYLPLALAPLMLVGVVTLILTVPRSPVVECHPDGSVSESSTWRDQSGSSEASSNADGVEGVIRFDDATYTFRCEDGALTEFTRTPS